VKCRQQGAGEIGGKGWRHAHPERAAGEIFDIVNGAAARLQRPERFPGIAHIDLTGIGQADLPPAAVEQLRAQSSLKLPNLLGERGLGNVQRLGRPGKSAVFRHGQKIGDMS